MFGHRTASVDLRKQEVNLSLTAKLIFLANIEVTGADFFPRLCYDIGAGDDVSILFYQFNSMQTNMSDTPMRYCGCDSIAKKLWL